MRFVNAHDRSGDTDHSVVTPAPDREAGEAAEEGRSRRVEPCRRQHAEQRSTGDEGGEQEREPSDPDERSVGEPASEEERTEGEGRGGCSGTAGRGAVRPRRARAGTLASWKRRGCPFHKRFTSG